MGMTICMPRIDSVAAWLRLIASSFRRGAPPKNKAMYAIILAAKAASHIVVSPTCVGLFLLVFE